MALIASSPAKIRDVQSFVQGAPSRAGYNDGAVYLVTRADTDSYVHIVKWDGSLTDYSSVGHAVALTSETKEAMIAAVQVEEILHVAYYQTDGSTSYLRYFAFDMETDAFSGAQEEVIVSATGTLTSSALQMVADPDGDLHVAIMFLDVAGTHYSLNYYARTSGAWSGEQISFHNQTRAPDYLPAIDADGRVLILTDNGLGGLEDAQWTAWERESAGVWTETDIEGLGPATLCHTDGGIRHALFFGDKRHTIIAGPVSDRETELGAIQFEQPDIEGGVIDGVIYGYGFSVVTDKNVIHVFAAASGRLYQGRFVDEWEPLRVISDLASTSTTKVAVVASMGADGDFGVAAKVNEKAWYLFQVDQTVPPRGGVTHDITIDGYGFMLAAPLQKADISQAVPRVSLATELKTEDQLSDLSSVTQYTFHHGRGEDVFENPFAYAEVDGLLTHIPNQVTPQLAPVLVGKAGGATASSFLIGPGGSKVGGTSGIGPAITDVASTALSGYPVDDVVYAGNYWILVRGTTPADNDLYYLNNTTGLWTAEVAGLDVTNATPQDLEIHNEDLWVAQGDTDVARVYDFSASTWKDASEPAYCFKTFDAILWRADNINKIYYSSNADLITTSTWTLLGTVDDGSGTTGRIRRMEIYNGQLLIFADFGVWAVIINGDGSYTLMELLNDAPQRSALNGAAAANYGGTLYYNVGPGVTRYDGGSRSDMGPNRNPQGGDKFNPLPLEKRGDFSHMVATDALMFMSIDAGATGTSSVWSFNNIGWNEFWRADAVGQRCRWVSHTPRFTSTGILSTRNMWVECAGSVYRIQLPAMTENPLDDETVTYRAGGQYKLMLGWQHQNLIAVDKVLHELLARFENFSVNELEPNLHVYFQTEDGPDSLDLADWTYLATFSRNPGETSNILNRTRWTANPDEYVGAVGGLSYKQIRFMLVFDMDLGGATTTMTPPVLRAFGQRFVLRTDRRFGFTAVVQAYSEVVNLLNEKETDQHDLTRHRLFGMAEQRAPHFLDDGTMPAMVNRVLNPGFELDSDDDGLANEWTKVNSAAVTTSRTAKNKLHGRYSQNVVVAASTVTSGIEQNGIYLPPGVSCHAQVGVFVESGIGAQVLAVNAVTGEVLGRSDVAYPVLSTRPPAVFRDCHLHVEAQSIGIQVSLQVVVPSEMADNATGTVMHVDDAFLYLGVDNVPHHYIDGDQPRCQWTDDTVEPYLSHSYRRGTYAMYINGINESLTTSIPTTGGRTIQESMITLQMREAGV